jgi:hypothetical protein
MRRRGGGQGCSVGGRSGAEEEEWRAGEGLVRCGILRAHRGGFYRAGEGRQDGGEGRLNGRSNGSGVNGNFKRL